MNKRTMRPAIAYFSGCTAAYTDPDVGRATVLVLEKNGFAVTYPEQRCCGMPLLGAGNPEAMLDRAHYNVRSLIATNTDIVTACTTCALTLKQFYPRLLGTAEAEEVSGHVYELGDYLVRLQEEGHLDSGFARVSDDFLYHAPCHLKSMGAGLVESRLRLLARIPGVSIARVDRGCCGLAGGFGTVRQTRELSMQIGSSLFDSLKEAQNVKAVTECPGCKLQIGHSTGLAVIHPVQILREAYRL